MTPWLALWLTFWPHMTAECEKQCLDHGYFLKSYESASVCYCEPFKLDHSETLEINYEYVPFVD